jgi:hypothetical protein
MVIHVCNRDIEVQVVPAGVKGFSPVHVSGFRVVESAAEVRSSEGMGIERGGQDLEDPEENDTEMAWKCKRSNEYAHILLVMLGEVRAICCHRLNVIVENSVPSTLHSAGARRRLQRPSLRRVL